jgi:hypothetical protein
VGKRKLMNHFVVRKGFVHRCISKEKPPKNLRKLRKTSRIVVQYIIKKEGDLWNPAALLQELSADSQ